MAIIQVEGLSFAYPGYQALQDVAFSIPENSITALVGPNGAGKTTLLRCISALEYPQAGSIMLNGIDAVNNPRECHKIIGYLSDFFGLYESLTVQQCLRFVAGSYKLEDPESAVEEAIETLGLQAHIHKKTSELSRGWRQRVGIAQAILHSPKVLILDEPASGLDPEARAYLASTMKYLQSKGMTIVVSSHILSELSEYSTHMLIIENGRVIDFSAVNESSAQSIPLYIELSEANEAFNAYLDNQQNFSIIRSDESVVEGVLAGEKADQANLLKALVEQGFPVMRYEVKEKDMQKVYLDKIQSQREGGLV